MKQRVEGIIVVEGITDIAFLSNFIDAEFVATNGSEISKKTLEYLKNCSEKRDIFVLTDPDSPGKKIRDVLDQSIPNLKHCFVRKEHSIKKGKVGVAESSKEEVLSAIKNFITYNKENVGHLTHADLVSLGLEGDSESSLKRNKIIEKYHLGYCNAKTFLKRLNYSLISFEELKNSL